MTAKIRRILLILATSSGIIATTTMTAQAGPLTSPITASPATVNRAAPRTTRVHRTRRDPPHPDDPQDRQPTGSWLVRHDRRGRP